MRTRSRREPRIALEGRVDAAAVERCNARVADALGDGAARIVVDLRAVTVLPLPELRLVCRLLRQAGRAGAARIAVVGGPPHARQTIALCAIDGVELRPEMSGGAGAW